MILAIWKPKGPTSHDVVDAVRHITGEGRVGHAGTLDPQAEGVLVIGIGREATRKLKEIVGQEKEYVARIQLGATSSTDDAEGVVTETQNAKRKTQNEIEVALRTFIGRIQQVPPVYSAVKIKGKPAYRRVRSGEAIALKPRAVEIKEITLLEYAPPPHRNLAGSEAGGQATPPLTEGERRGGVLTLRVVCGPGTYIRSLARDLGEQLGVGGYLAALTRTRVGTFTRETALTLEQFQARWCGLAKGSV